MESVFVGAKWSVEEADDHLHNNNRLLITCTKYAISLILWREISSNHSSYSTGHDKKLQQQINFITGT